VLLLLLLLLLLVLLLLLLCHTLPLDHRKAHAEDVEMLKMKLGKARDRIGVVESAY
jgi:hypothetical protein